MKRIASSARIVFLALPLLFALPASAATTSLDLRLKTPQVSVHDTFEADLTLTTGGDAVNAVEGTITFPGDLLELKGIKDGNSIVSFWVEPPRLKGGHVRFAGIIPGGYLGSDGRILSLDFQAKLPGSAAIGLQAVRVLLNDGKGTDAQATASGARVTIADSAPASPAATATPEVPATVPENPDHAPPEAFTPVVTRDASMFGGKYFLVFDTQDKGSGIDHYEVCEGAGSDCVSAASPYVLKDQALDQDILVKAFDGSGNERQAFLARNKSRPWLEGLFIVIAFLLLIGLIAAPFRRGGRTRD